MKRLIIASAVWLLGISVSGASTFVDFRGGLCILSVSQICKDFKETEVGACYQMRYSPPNIANNGPETNLSILEFDGAHNYRLNSGSIIGTTFKTVDGTVIFRRAATFTAKLRVISQTPANLASASTASIVGNIKDFNFLPGCDVKFNASGPRHEYIIPPP